MNLFTLIAIFLILYIISEFEEFLYYLEVYSGRRVRHQKIYGQRHSTRHQRFLELLLAMAAKICRADGVVQSSEIERLNHLIHKRLKIDERTALRAKRVFSRAKDDGISFDEYLAKFYREFGTEHELLEVAYDFLWMTAEVGGIVAAEQVLLNKARSAFGIFGGQSRQGGRSHGVGSLSDAYQVLGCKPEMSMNEVKRRYRKLMLELHPDKLHAKGMSAEFINISKERFLRVQEAYERIEAARK